MDDRADATPLDLQVLQALIDEAADIDPWLGPAQAHEALQALAVQVSKLVHALTALRSRVEQAERERDELRQQYILVMNERNAADDAYTAIEERAEAAEDDAQTLRAHLAAIDTPETILYDDDHPDGLTPAMRALRTAIEQRDLLASALAGVREQRDTLQQREQGYLNLLARVAAGIYEQTDRMTFRATFGKDVVSELFEISTMLERQAALRGTGEGQNDA